MDVLTNIKNKRPSYMLVKLLFCISLCFVLFFHASGVQAQSNQKSLYIADYESLFGKQFKDYNDSHISSSSVNTQEKQKIKDELKEIISHLNQVDKKINKVRQGVSNQEKTEYIRLRSERKNTFLKFNKLNRALARLNDTKGYERNRLIDLLVYKNTIENTSWVDSESASLLYHSDNSSLNIESVISSPDVFSGTVYYDAHGSILNIGNHSAQELAKIFANKLTVSSTANYIEKLKKIVFMSCDLSQEYLSSFRHYLHIELNNHFNDLPQDIEIYGAKYTIGLTPAFSNEGSSIVPKYGLLNIGHKYIDIQNFDDAALAGAVNHVTLRGKHLSAAQLESTRKTAQEQSMYLNKVYAEKVPEAIGYELYVNGFRLINYPTAKGKPVSLRTRYLNALGDAQNTEIFFNTSLNLSAEKRSKAEEIALQREMTFTQISKTANEYAASHTLSGSLFIDSPPYSNSNLEATYRKRLAETLDANGIIAGNLEWVDRSIITASASPPVKISGLKRKLAQVLPSERGATESIALSHDHALLMKHIHSNTPAGSVVLEESVTSTVVNGQLEVSYETQASAGVKETRYVTIDTEQLASHTLINRGLAIHGGIIGFAQAINALENGDTIDGTILLAQSTHGLMSLSGYDKRIASAASRALGQSLKPAVQVAMGTLVKQANTSLIEAGRALRVTAESASTMLEAVPILGTAFGIYNVYEDLQRHDTQGNIDAALDATILALALDPALEPVAISLTLLRLGFDDYYTDIKNELDKSGSSTQDKLVAVTKGFAEGTADVYKDYTLLGQIVKSIEASHELDEKAVQQQVFLESLKNYNNYYQNTNNKINFLNGSVQDVGAIDFTLGEPNAAGTGLSPSKFTYTQLGHSETVNVNTNANTIILGIGESIKEIQYHKESAKFLFFIPIHSRTVMTPPAGDVSTRHGRYTGNSANNQFIAVQDDLRNQRFNFTASEYHYELNGGGGDDLFVLGPQKSFVNGGAGQDTYILTPNSSSVTVNNCVAVGNPKTDFLQLPLKAKQLGSTKFNNDLIIYTEDNTDFLTADMKYLKERMLGNSSSSNPAQPVSVDITIKNWFDLSQKGCRHLHLRTSDNAEIAIQEDGTFNVVSVKVDLTESAGWMDFSEDPAWQYVKSIVGAALDSDVTANNNDNILSSSVLADMGLPASRYTDRWVGLGGSDLYLLRRDKNYTIDNHDPQKALDAIIIPQRFEDITVSQLGDDIQLTSGDFALTMEKWLLNEDYQHALFVSKDQVIFTLDTSQNEVTREVISMNYFAEKGDRATAGAKVIRLSGLYQDAVTAYGSGFDSNEIHGNWKDNYLVGGDKRNTIYGYMGDDTLMGGTHCDTIYGGDGDDLIHSIDGVAKDSGGCHEIIDAGPGDDTVITGGTHIGIPEFHGGPGFDKLVFTGNVATQTGVTVDLTRHIWGWYNGENLNYQAASYQVNGATTTNIIRHFEAFIGTPYNDIFRGRDTVDIAQPANMFKGNAGDDSFYSGKGDDYMEGGNGKDTYYISAGASRSTGTKIIYNYANDSELDILDLSSYDSTSIQCDITGIDYTISITGIANLSIVLKDWFMDKRLQHLNIQAKDKKLILMGYRDVTSPLPIPGLPIPICGIDAPITR